MRHLSTDLRRRNPQKSNQRYPPQSLPSLFYAVSSRNWDTVIRRTQTHPHEITSRNDVSGDTPLHIAVKFQPPVEVIHALRWAREIANDDMMTPLHVAASHRCTVDGIRALLEEGSVTNNSVVDAGAGDDDNSDRKRSSRRIPLALSVSKIGRVPLHYACAGFRGLHVDAFKVLLEATVDACVYMEQTKLEEDENDDTDLLDWEEAAESQQNDSNVFTMQDRLGHTPLSLLFKRYRERVKMVIRLLDIRNSTSSSSTAVRLRALQEEMELGDLWQKATLTVCLLAHKTQCHKKEQGEILEDDFLMKLRPTDAAIALMAANRAAEQYQRSSEVVDRTNDTNENNDDVVEEENAAELESDRKFRLVHSSVSLAGYGCPTEMIRLAMSVYPHQVHEMDEDGNLPIHLAATASSFLPPTASGDSGNCNDEESSFLSFLSTLSGRRDSHPFDRVIRMLLRSYPEAAKIPHGQTGRLPLILAIDAGQRTMDDGIRALLEAYPAALESRSFDHRMYPTILSLLAQPKPEKKKKASTGSPPSNNVTTFRRSRLSLRRTNAIMPKPSSESTHISGPLFELLRAKPNLMQNFNYEH